MATRCRTALVVAALCMPCLPARPALGQQQTPQVSSATIWIDTVQRGDLVTEVRGPGVLERFGRGFHAQARVAARAAVDVALDQTATVDTRSQVLAGRVVDIADRVEQGTVALVIEVTGEIPAGLRPGLSVDVRVQTGRLEDVLYVSRPAFGEANQKAAIFKVVDDGRAAERVAVTWGTASVDKIEVRDGLVEGDRIILSDMSRYDAADRVRIVG